MDRKLTLANTAMVIGPQAPFLVTYTHEYSTRQLCLGRALKLGVELSLRIDVDSDVTHMAKEEKIHPVCSVRCRIQNRYDFTLV